MLNNFLKNLTKDVEVQLNQEFDRNFERKAFFDKKWPATKHNYSKGSLLMRSGKLRRSIKSDSKGSAIRWSSAMPYASLQNEGGEIIVTEKMKRFFWAMFYKTNNAVLFNVKKKKAADTIRNRKLQGEAAKWKAMALMKVGTVMTIDQRQFIGWHPMVDKHVKNIANINLKELNAEILKKLK